VAKILTYFAGRILLSATYFGQKFSSKAFDGIPEGLIDSR